MAVVVMRKKKQNNIDLSRMTSTRAAAILVAIGCPSGRWLGGKDSYWSVDLIAMTENEARAASYLRFILINKSLFVLLSFMFIV